MSSARDKYGPFQGQQSRGWSSSLVWTFIQIFQKPPEPGWIVKEYIDEKKSGQWQEEDAKVNQEYG